ncbi:MAG: hypothetical protein JJ957_10010 [Pseudomonadales bacterium]|nr:hypothetical protein [Pseudomonadales bacterium]MBO6596168.1 hypothetical protein [Pseudomonadales bacterium]MBO6822648.1 hypothetical protein [Pseudomonadales bacterium]
MGKKTTDELLYEIMADLDARKPTSPDKLKRKVMILSTPRSGSTLFCDSLNRTKQLGECREWFNLRYISAYAQLKQISSINFQDYFYFIVTQTLRGTDTLVVNMHIDQHQSLIQQNLDPFGFRFDEVFYINRKNKLRQAVSLARAWQTDQWGADTKAKNPEPEALNPALISQALNMLLSNEHFYRENLRKLVSLEFDYEVFRDLDNPEGLPKLFGLLGLKVDTETTTDMKKQSDRLSDEAYSHFLAYIQGK